MIFPCYHSATSQQQYPTTSRCDNTSLLRSRGLHNLTTTSTTLSYNAIATWLGIIVTSMTHHLYRATMKLPWQHRRQYDSTALSPAWLGLYIMPWLSSPDSAIVSMTRHLHHVAAKLPSQRHHEHDSITLSLAWLDIYIAPRLSHPSSVVASMTQQYCCQHDSARILRRDQVAPAAPSPAWLNIYIMLRPSHPSSVITSMTR
jgi:hypothetical protein